jgi:hypothetical protein
MIPDCTIDMRLTFRSHEDASAFEEFFKAKINECTGCNEGIFIGSERRLFEPVIDYWDEVELMIEGWTENGFYYMEAEKLIQFINGVRPLTKATIMYENACSCLYGKYIYADSIMREIALPYDHKVWNNPRIYRHVEALYQELEDAWDDDAVMVHSVIIP